MKRKKVCAFTLLEMVVVVIIIMILATLVVLSLGGVKKRARDDRRMADAQTIASALSQYATSNNRYYPPFSSSETPWDQGYYTAEVIESSSVVSSILSGPYHKKIAGAMPPFGFFLSSYLNPVPVDPLNGRNNFRYVYIYRDNGREAAVVVDKFEFSGRCNIPGNTNLPTGVQKYANRELNVQPPSEPKVPCYYVSR